MEEVLDVYSASYSDSEVLICMDEASKQLLRDEVPPIPMAPGRPRREDYHYDRRGTQAIFMFFDPVRGRPSAGVGIGLTNPAAKLHVSGNVRIDGNVTVSGNVSGGSKTFIHHMPKSRHCFRDFVKEIFKEANGI